MAHPFIPAENVAKVEMIMTTDGQIIENVFNVYHATGAFGIADMGLLAANFKGWWDANLKAAYSPDVSLTMIRVTDRTTENAPGIEYQTGLPIVGTGAGTQFSNNVCVAVKWITGYRGRSFRGRTYHGPLTSTWVTRNTLSGGNAGLLQTKYTALITGMLADWQLAVVSEKANGSWRLSALVTPITGCTVNGTVDSQRRRLPGRGR